MMLDDFREWLSDNLRYILLGLAIILIVVIGFCVVRLITSGGKPSEKKGAGSGEAVTESVSGDSVNKPAQGDAGSSNTTPQSETAAAGTTALTKDDTAILTLMRTYYDAITAEDAQALEAIYDPIAWAQVKDKIFNNNDVIESYSNLSTYSKKGPVDGSYVVYNYYEAKVANIDTLAPSLVMLYVITDENGNLVISDRNASQEVSDYIASITSDADVQNLRADVNQLLEQATSRDAKLKEFIDSLQDNTEENSQQDQNSGGMSGEMVATATVNIRQEPSTEAQVLGSVPEGFSVTVLQETADGWCQVDFTAAGTTVSGYVRSEYLTTPETEAPVNSGSSDDVGGDNGAANPITVY